MHRGLTAALLATSLVPAWPRLAPAEPASGVPLESGASQTQPEPQAPIPAQHPAQSPAPPQSSAQPAAKPGARRTLSLQQAMKASEPHVVGTFIGAELEAGEQEGFWRLRLLGQDEKPYEAYVASTSGKVLEVSRVEFDSQAPAGKKPPKAAVSLSDAADAAMRRVPGQVVSAGLEEREGKAVWRITVEPKGETGEHEVEVSGERAEVLAVDPQRSGDQNAKPAATTPTRRTVSLSQAMAVGARMVRGTLFAAGLAEVEERQFWQLRMIGQDGRIYHATLDATSAKPVQTNRVDYSVEYEQARPKLPALPIEQALRAAAAAVPGEAIGALADPSSQAPIWGVAMVAQKDGEEHEVIVGGMPASALAIDGQRLGQPKQSAAGARKRPAGKRTVARRPAKRRATRGPSTSALARMMRGMRMMGMGSMRARGTRATRRR